MRTSQCSRRGVPQAGMGAMATRLLLMTGGKLGVSCSTKCRRAGSDGCGLQAKAKGTRIIDEDGLLALIAAAPEDSASAPAAEPAGA